MFRNANSRAAVFTSPLASLNAPSCKTASKLMGFFFEDRRYLGLTGVVLFFGHAIRISLYAGRKIVPEIQVSIWAGMLSASASFPVLIRKSGSCKRSGDRFGDKSAWRGTPALPG